MELIQAVGLAKFANPESLAEIVCDQQILSGGELKRLEVAHSFSSKFPFC